MTTVFLLQKYIHKPRTRGYFKTKWVEIKARDTKEARSFVDVLYIGWDVSMFWPKSIIKDGKYIQL